MAIDSTAGATWRGDLGSGSGSVRPGSGAFPEQEVTWRRRSEGAAGGTSPEELLAAAHAACYSMALSNDLAKAGHAPEQLDTRAVVSFQPGQGITGIELRVRGRVPGIDEAGFRASTEAAKANCPVSKALASVPVTLAEAVLEV